MYSACSGCLEFTADSVRKMRCFFQAGDKALVNLDLSVHKTRAKSKKKGIKYNATFGQALQWALSTMIEKHIMPQVSNSQWLKNLKVMIQTQAMTASKITTVMPVLCGYILGMICLLNALPRPLVPLTLCQPSNLAGINFQPCKSLRSPLIPAQTSALALFPSLPLQQEALRAFSLCCPSK